MTDTEDLGGHTDIYSWTQTTTQVLISVNLPAGVRGRDLDVRMEVNSLHVAVKGGDTLISGELYAKVKPLDCIWTVADGIMEIMLHKFRTREWSRCAFVFLTFLRDSQLSADKTWWKSAIKGEGLNINDSAPTSYYFTKDRDV